MKDKEIEVIIKPIFTKMFNENFSACDYGIECFKKGMEYQGIKELTIENENLIKQVRILKTQIEKMKCCANCKHSRTEYEHCKTDEHEKWEIKENG